MHLAAVRGSAEAVGAEEKEEEAETVGRRQGEFR
jgi:hypothetical protein